MNIAENLKKMRLANHLSQSFIAKKLNMSRQGYNHYETGRSEPDYNTLVEIAKIFGTTPDSIMGITDEPIVIVYPDNEKSRPEKTERDLKYEKIMELTDGYSDEEMAKIYDYIDLVNARRNKNK